MAAMSRSAPASARVRRAATRTVGAGVSAFALLCSGCRPEPSPGSIEEPAPIETRVLKTSALTPAERRFGRAPKPDRTVTYEDAVVIVGGGADVVRAISPDGVTCTIDARAGKAGDLSVGRIAFVTGRCVGRVLSMKRERDDLSLVLGPVELVEIFRTLDVRVEQPIDLNDVIRVPPPQLEGVTFPLEGADAALPEWSRTPGAIAPSRAPAAPGRALLVTPAALRAARAQNAPVSPGITQRLNLTWHTTPLNDAHGIGAELRHDARGIRLIAQVQIRVPAPSLDFHLKIWNKYATGRLILKNAAGLTLAFDGATGEAFSGNVNWHSIGPGFSIPLAGPVPLAVDVRQDIWVRTAFSARQSMFSAGGDYGLNGDVGLAFQGTHFMTVGPKGLTVERSLMRNMNAVSMGPSGLVISHVATVTAGVGAWGFTTGPSFGLATSLGVAQGSSAGIVQCQGATLSMHVQGGVGWTIPQAVAKFVNFFLDILRVKPIPDHGGAYTDWRPLFPPMRAQTESQVCGGAGSQG
jgi:hypothetical protein